MSIKNMSVTSRPRERAQTIGIKNLSDVELLAIIIASGTHESSALALATDLLEKTSNLYGLSRINLNTIRLKGLGPVKKISILAAIELGKRVYLQDGLDKRCLKDAISIYQFVYPKYFGLLKEHFSIILLDRNYNFVYEEKQEEGNVKDITISLSWVMRVVANNQAPYVVLVHNHPSNILLPSKGDDITTYSIMESIRIMKIELLDHLIIGEEGYYSYKENDRLKNISKFIKL